MLVSIVVVSASATALAPALAQITTDGSVGPVAELTGPDYDIPAELGKQSGSSLFHSFERFGIAEGEVATFTDRGATAPIDRVLSRVTGGEPSAIDGRLRSTVPGADFYFMNPAGVLFGPGARIDVPASLYVSTADTVEFPNGERFEARANGEVPTLAVAPPQSFGFLSENPAPITIERSQLGVREGQGMAFVGGDIEMDGRRFPTSNTREIVARSGRLDMVSVGSPGRVGFTGAPDDAPIVDGVEKMGTIQFDGGWASTRGDAGGGRIFLRGGEIVLDTAAVESNSRTAHDAGSVDIEADSLRVTDSLVGAFATSLSTGNGGSVRIEAREVSVEAVEAVSRIEATTAGAGHGGTIDIAAEEVRLRGTGEVARIDARTFGSGPAGSIRIVADRVLAEGSRGAAIDASSTSDGDAGSIEVRARTVQLDEGGYIGAAAFGDGPARAGDVRVEADDVTLRRSVLDAGSFSDTGGGSISVDAERVELDDAGVFVHTFGTGSSGRIAIDAGRIVLDATTEVSANGWGAGDAGAVEIRADHLVVDDSIVDASAHGPGAGGHVEITADIAEFVDGGVAGAATSTAGDAGSVSIASRELRLRNGHVKTIAFHGPGNAGTIRIDAGRLLMTERSSLDAGSLGDGRGGAIDIEADGIELSDSVVFTHAYGAGDAGPIAIDAEQMRVDAGSEISANGIGTGDASRIEIRAGALQILDGSILFAEGFGSGDAGAIVIAAERFDASASALRASSRGGGRGGRVDVSAAQLRVVDGAQVRARAVAEGDAGSIALRAAESITISGADTDVEVSARRRGEAGRIEIAAPAVLLDDHAVVSSSVRGLGDGGAIRIAGDRIVIRGGALVSTSALAGGTGTIEVVAAESIAISNEGGDPLSLSRLLREDVPGPSGVYAATLFGSGTTGAVRIRAPQVEIADGGIVATTTLGPSDAGSITIEADHVAVLDGGLIDSSSGGSGAAGAVRIDATGSIRVAGAGSDGVPSRVRSAATADGAGGDVALTAPDVRLDGGAIATTTVGADGTGAGGAIAIDADRVRLTGGGRIDSGSFSGSDGGTVRVVARDSLEIEGAETGIFAETGGAGGGGDLEIEAGVLRIADRGLITTRSGAAIARAAAVFEDAVGGGFVPALRAPAGSVAGPAGDVRITAGHVELAGGSIDTEAREGAGGNIDLRVANTAMLTGSTITASVGSGSGGNVRVEAPLLVLHGSRIVAQADAGSGGSIAVRSDLLLSSPDSEISASARLGIDGRVVLDTPETDLAGTLVALPSAPLDATDLLRERCADVRSDAMGSFVVGGRASVPASFAEGLLLALVPVAPRSEARGTPAVALPAAAGGVLAPRLGCAARASY